MDTTFTSFEDFQQKWKSEWGLLEDNIRKVLSFLSGTDSKGEESNHVIRHSLFISVYSYFESALRNFALLVSKDTKFKRRVAGFDKVHQFYYFFINDMKFSDENLISEWDRLNVFRDIRNCIVHYHSTIGKSINTKSFEFISEDPRIQFIEPRDFRIKDDDLILEFLQISERFLNNLMIQRDGSGVN